jgi:hypothetical protein
VLLLLLHRLPLCLPPQVPPLPGPQLPLLPAPQLPLLLQANLVSAQVVPAVPAAPAAAASAAVSAVQVRWTACPGPLEQAAT